VTTSSLVLVLSAFLACAVEAVEALTVILAVGVTRGWRSALLATLTASVSLVALVVVLGPALSRVPLGWLRVTVGSLLLVFGIGWLRKAILRASGYKALRDEAALYQKQLQSAQRAGVGGSTGRTTDWYGFALVFKAVFLEGLEVAFIVLTFGTAQGSIRLATLGAGLAVILVGAVGIVLHRPLARVPENAMKFSVGLMISTFGIFWSSEGVGVAWPGEDLSIFGILAFMTVTSLCLVAILRKAQRARPPTFVSTPGATG
jgi:uncharacterized membrane protein